MVITPIPYIFYLGKLLYKNQQVTPSKKIVSSTIIPAGKWLAKPQAVILTEPTVGWFTSNAILALLGLMAW